jgi:hypothetical protein
VHFGTSVLALPLKTALPRPGPRQAYTHPAESRLVSAFDASGGNSCVDYILQIEGCYRELTISTVERSFVSSGVVEKTFEGVGHRGSTSHAA